VSKEHAAVQAPTVPVSLNAGQRGPETEKVRCGFWGSSLEKMRRNFFYTQGPGCPSDCDAALTNQTSLVRFPSTLYFS